MAAMRLKYVYRDKDRQGRIRWLLRVPRLKAVTLKGTYGSPEFMQNYNEAIASAEPTLKKGLGIPKAGTIAALRPLFYDHAIFTSKKPATRRSLRSYIDRLAEDHGDKPVCGGKTGLRQEHVQAMVDAKVATPSAARNFLIALRLFMKVAIKKGWRTRGDDPTIGVELPKIRGRGYRPWTDENAAAYEAGYPLGTRERLAYEIFSCMALRLGDAARLRRQHIHPLKQSIVIGALKITHELRLPYQEKTGECVEGLLILPQLQAAIDALAVQGLDTFLVTAEGKPFSKGGLANWFRERCRAVGLIAEVIDDSGHPKGLSPHGLRKRMGNRLADLNCSDEQIVAVLGHTDTRQVKVYTRGANKRRMRQEASLTLAKAEHPRTSELHTPATGLHTRK